MQEYVGELVLDTRRNNSELSPTAELRSGAFGPALQGAYQLLYQVDGGRVAVDLQMQRVPDSSRFNLIGQVVGSQGPERQVELVPIKGIIIEGDAAMKSTADETFTFRYPDLQPGSYGLSIYSGLEDIRIMPLNL